MPIKLIIKEADVLTSRINGKSGVFESTSQTAWLDLPSGERRKIRVRLAKDAKPYAVGEYLVGDASFVVNEYGDLGLGNLALVPVAAAPGMRAAS